MDVLTQGRCLLLRADSLAAERAVQQAMLESDLDRIIDELNVARDRLWQQLRELDRIWTDLSEKKHQIEVAKRSDGTIDVEPTGRAPVVLKKLPKGGDHGPKD